MSSLFDTPADNLPLHLQSLRLQLWRAWEATPLPRLNWVKLIGALGMKDPATAFASLLEAKVLESDGADKFFLNGDA
jgi:hypothetical protein